MTVIDYKPTEEIIDVVNDVLKNGNQPPSTISDEVFAYLILAQMKVESDPMRAIYVYIGPTVASVENMKTTLFNRLSADGHVIINSFGNTITVFSGISVIFHFWGDVLSYGIPDFGCTKYFINDSYRFYSYGILDSIIKDCYDSSNDVIPIEDLFIGFPLEDIENILN